MSIEHVLAVVPVGDFEAAHAWYERLLGRPADNRPMDGLADWRVTETGWVQVTRGLDPGTIEAANKNVRLSAITDPDGNRVTFIENFRIE